MTIFFDVCHSILTTILFLDKILFYVLSWVHFVKFRAQVVDIYTILCVL